MSNFPANMDLDKVVRLALEDVNKAVAGWIKGVPRDEVALLNRLTERLSRRRRGCDVGLEYPMSCSVQMANLHRQGDNQADLYGSDLAITFSVDGNTYLKTALFQLKKSSSLKVELKHKQLCEASFCEVIANRSFVVAIDENRQGLRINGLLPLKETFPAGQDKHQINTTSWISLTEWLNGWLSCSIGPASDPSDPDSIETLLEYYREELPEGPIWKSNWQLPERLREPLEVIPVRTWIAMMFESEKE